MSEIASRALAIALNEKVIGAGEQGGNNAGPYVEKYLNGLAEPPSNWCAGLVSWSFLEASKQLGIEMPFKYALAARGLYNQFRHSTTPSLEIVEVPAPGDIIFFWRNNINSWEGHVGIISSMSSNLIVTIEGNKGKFPAKVDGYRYPRRSIPQFLGFGRVL